MLRGFDYTKRAISKQVYIRDAIKECRKDLLSRYKPGETRRNNSIMLDQLTDLVGDLPVTTGVGPLDRALSTVPQNTYVRLKLHLERIYAYCYRAEYLPLTHTNPATVLADKKLTDPVRERLSLEQYRAIYKAAEPWLQVAMDIMLFTTLRPGDACNLKFSQYKEGALWVKTAKTGKTLCIRLSGREQGVIARARQSGLASQYIIHRAPQRRVMRPSERAFSVTPRYLSTAFKNVRNKLGIGGDNPPALYEIRSLGGRLYKDAGRDKKEIQRLYGHTEEGTTTHYLENRMDIYEEVYAGLEV